MIRVMHFADLINQYDFIDNAITYLDPVEFEVSACLLSGKGNFPRAGSSVKVFNLGYPKFSFWHYPAIARRLAKLIKKEKIDILHTHHFYPTLIGCMAAVLSGVPFVIGHHYSNELKVIANPAKRRAYFLLESICNHLSKKVIVPSFYAAALLKEHDKKIAAKLAVVSYGYDFSRFESLSLSSAGKLRLDLGLSGKFSMAMIARLVEGKGHKYLFSALKKISAERRDVKLLVLGEGPLRDGLEKKVSEMGLSEFVSFTGWRADVLEVINAVDLVVQPTLQDSFCSILVEALSLSKPLIITDIGAAPELLRNGVDAFIVQHSDADALYAAIKQVMADPGRAGEMAARGRARVRELTDISNIIPVFEGIYKGSLPTACGPARRKK